MPRSPTSSASAGYYLFTDASLDADLAKGVGACLILKADEIASETELLDLRIKTQLMNSDSISRLEIMTVLWGLEELNLHSKASIEIVTDCQAIHKLTERRTRLELLNFRSRRTNLLLSNADLYQRFFKAKDELNFGVTWIKGHSPKRQQTPLQRIFARVDKASRQALRELRRSV